MADDCQPFWLLVCYILGKLIEALYTVGKRAAYFHVTFFSTNEFSLKVKVIFDN